MSNQSNRPRASVFTLDPRRGGASAPGGAQRSLRIVVNAVAVRGGGALTFLVNILEALCESEPAHEYVVIVSPRQRALAALLPTAVRTIECRSVPSPAWLRVAWEQVVLPVLLRRWRADVLFAAFNTAVLASPAPVVLVSHSVNAYSRLPIRWPLYMSVRHAALRALGRLSARVAGAVVFVSETSANVMAPRMGVPRSRVRVVPYGWRDTGEVPGGGTRRDPPSLPDRFILTVGDLLEHKNVELLLEAFEELVVSSDYPGDLVVVGGSSSASSGYLERLLALRERLACRDRVHLLGSVAARAMPAVYAAAELFVLPSLEETFGIPLVEAMGAGVPVVVSDWRLSGQSERDRTNVGPEICGEAAEFFDPTDFRSLARAMDRVLGDGARREEMVTAGRARARTFSWRRAARSFLEIFGQLRIPAPATRP
jgi:glycosyltransferase involved in cell wall biosynthesis